MGMGMGCDEPLLSEKKFLFFSVKMGRHSVNEGFSKNFHRKGNSVKRSRPFSQLPDSAN